MYKANIPFTYSADRQYIYIHVAGWLISVDRPETPDGTIHVQCAKTDEPICRTLAGGVVVACAQSLGWDWLIEEAHRYADGVDDEGDGAGAWRTRPDGVREWVTYG